ncbi:MAG: zf-HC2 domain-containing protein [Planctomycetota bacterium]
MNGPQDSNTAGMHCARAIELLPRYLDGELPEGQAQALRQHLLACPACRSSASEGRTLERWFEPLPAPAVPQGFAARVAAAAARLDPATVAHEPEGPAPALVSERAAPAGELREFVLVLTAVAAAALFALSILLGLRDRPQGDGLMAEPLNEVLLELETLNAETVDGDE